MRKPISGDTKIRQYCRKFVDFAEHWFVKSLLRPVFFLLPPSMLTLVVTREGLRKDIESLFGPSIESFLSQSALLVLICAYLYVILLKSLYSAIEHYSKPERELSRDDIDAILRSINSIVGDKMKRFSGHVKKNLNSSSMDPREVFREITQPSQQIGLLVCALRSAFEFIDQTDALFRVGLLIIENKNLTDWAHFDPAERPPRTLPRELAHPRSTVMLSLEARSTIIVEDIAKELNKKIRICAGT